VVDGREPGLDSRPPSALGEWGAGAPAEIRHLAGRLDRWLRSGRVTGLGDRLDQQQLVALPVPARDGAGRREALRTAGRQLCQRLALPRHERTREVVPADLAEPQRRAAGVEHLDDGLAVGPYGAHAHCEEHPVASEHALEVGA
jgi:hypothetical protein